VHVPFQYWLILKEIGNIMKVFGIVLLLAGLFFLIYTGLNDYSEISPSAAFTPWAGMIVIATGGVLYYKARNE